MSGYARRLVIKGSRVRFPVGTHVVRIPLYTVGPVLRTSSSSHGRQWQTPIGSPISRMCTESSVLSFVFLILFSLCLNCSIVLYLTYQLSAELATLRSSWQPWLYSFVVLDALVMFGMLLLVGFLSLFARHSLSPSFLPFSHFSDIQCFLFPSSAPYGP